MMSVLDTHRQRHTTQPACLQTKINGKSRGCHDPHRVQSVLHPCTQHPKTWPHTEQPNEHKQTCTLMAIISVANLLPACTSNAVLQVKLCKEVQHLLGIHPLLATVAALLGRTMRYGHAQQTYGSCMVCFDRSFAQKFVKKTD